MEYHNPVLLEESVKGLHIKPNGIYVDITFGGGGHSRKILNALGDTGKLFAFDQDADALQNTIEDHRFLLIHQNFRHIKRFLRLHGITKVDGILEIVRYSAIAYTSLFIRSAIGLKSTPPSPYFV